MLSKHQKYFFLVSDFCLLIFDIQNSRETRSKKKGSVETVLHGHREVARSKLWASISNRQCN